MACVVHCVLAMDPQLQTDGYGATGATTPAHNHRYQEVSYIAHTNAGVACLNPKLPNRTTPASRVARPSTIGPSGHDQATASHDGARAACVIAQQGHSSSGPARTEARRACHRLLCRDSRGPGDALDLESGAVLSPAAAAASSLMTLVSIAESGSESESETESETGSESGSIETETKTNTEIETDARARGASVREDYDAIVDDEPWALVTSASAATD